MKYEKQASRPDWYQSDENKTYAAATSGSSPFNEWYEFDDRDDALQIIQTEFRSQSFVDNFVEWAGEYYYTTDVQWDGDIPLVEKGAEADIQDMVNAESKF